MGWGAGGVVVVDVDVGGADGAGRRRRSRSRWVVVHIGSRQGQEWESNEVGVSLPLSMARRLDGKDHNCRLYWTVRLIERMTRQSSKARSRYMIFV